MTSLESASDQSGVLRVLRWVAVLPGALAAGWGAWLVVNIGNRLTFAMSGFDSDWFLARVFIEGVSNGAIGAAGVYAGAQIAPGARKVVVFGLAAGSMLAGGFLLFPAIVMRNWWAIYGVVALAFGAGLVAYSVYTGETSLD